MSTKINALVDENGLPVRLVLTAGQAHDLRAAPQLLAGLKCQHVVADLMTFYFRSTEANDDCYKALINREVCRPIAITTKKPEPISR